MNGLLAKAVAVTAFVTLGFVTPGLAQKDQVPNGRPFQMIARSLADLDANLAAQITALSTQLAGLEGRVDAVEQHSALQNQLIGALQAAQFSLEQRMTNAEGMIQHLAAWNAAQDAALAQLDTRASILQNQINDQGQSFSSAIGHLFALHQIQVQQIAQIEGDLDFISSAIATLDQKHGEQSAQISQLQGEAAGLQNQLDTLNTSHNLTRAQLQAGCPPGTSIRQVVFNGLVACEPDSGQIAQTTGISASVGVGPLSSAIAVAVCPPNAPTPPGGPTPPPWVATGGGYNLASLNQVVVSSAPANIDAWQVVVFNNNPLSTTTFTATAHCLRQAP